MLTGEMTVASRMSGVSGEGCHAVLAEQWEWAGTSVWMDEDPPAKDNILTF